MSPKKAVLRALRGAQRDAEHEHVRPPTIPGYSDQPERFQRAVNELLQARLVEGFKDPDGHMTIALNPHRRGDVERMLRPLWARPAVWAIAFLAAAVGVGLVVV